MITITSFDTVKYQPSIRKARCKNCDSMFGPRANAWTDGDILMPGEPRIVLTNSTSFGGATRHLSLCIDCAKNEMGAIETLLNSLREAVSLAPNIDK